MRTARLRRRLEAGAIAGCLTLAGLSVAVPAGAVGATWYTDNCTVQFGNHNANLTFQGWGAGGACRDWENSATNKVLHAIGLIGGAAHDLGIPLLGAADVHAHDGVAAGPTICDGWDGYRRYTVRDYGGLGLNVIGRAVCSTLPH